MMTLADKLGLNRPNQLTLIKEGLFLKTYNESCYILTELLGHKLKISGHFIKCLENRLVVGCAFPADTLGKRLPNAVLTAYGAALTGEFNLVNYNQWLSELSHRISAANVTRPTSVVTPPGDAALAADHGDHRDVDAMRNGILLALNATQLTYLVNWRRGNFPLEVEQGFIESLKNSL